MAQTPQRQTGTDHPASERGAAKQLMNGESTLVKRIKAIVRTEVDDVSVEMIEFGPVLSLHTDNNGRHYVEDLNGIVRYYIDSGRLVPTEELEESRAVVSQNQHSQTELRGLLNDS